VLGRTGDTAAVEPLVSALAEASRHAVAGAAIALSQLADAAPGGAERVADALSHVSHDALRVLRDLLSEGDVETRRAAAHVLTIARDVAALEGIATLAAFDDLSRGAATAFRAWGAEVVSPLLDAHERLEDRPRAVALELAADLGGATPRESAAFDHARLRGALRAALGAGHPALAAAAARSLAQWAEASDAEALVATAVDRDAEPLIHASATALDALAHRAPDAVRDALADVRLEGTAGAVLLPIVARLGGERTVERVQTAMSSDAASTRRSALEALSAIGGQNTVDDVTLALADESVDVRMAAARVLGSLRDEDGRPVGAEQLLLALSSESAAVRGAAARALGVTGDGRAVEALRELLRDREPGVAVAAMEGLRALRDPTLGDLLVEALGHQDDEVVKQALLALREAAGGRMAHRLTLGLSHPSWDVRRLAAGLLGQVGGDEVVAALRARLEDEPDDLVRAAVTESLNKLGEVPS
jgi:HEAT repeat protein